MKRSIILYLIAAALIAFALFKVIQNRREKHTVHTPGSQQVLTAEAYVARDTVVNYQINTVGTLRANEHVEIQSEVSQRLITINFHEGSFVRKGTLLFKLDDATLQAEWKKLRIQEELAVQNELRDHVLLEKGGISQQEYDETLNHLKTIQAEIESIEVDIEKTEILAPFSGRVGLRNVSEGAYIRPVDVLTTLKDVSMIKLDFTVPERYAGSIRKGQEVRFTIAGNPDTFTAIIDAFQTAVDVSTRNLAIRALAANTEGLLIPGLSVKVMLDFPESQPSIFIPTQCLIPTIRGYEVFKSWQGVIEAIQVKTGSRTDESVQILEGLLAGDTVIMTNLLRLKHGAKVNIIKTY